MAKVHLELSQNSGCEFTFDEFKLHQLIQARQSMLPFKVKAKETPFLPLLFMVTLIMTVRFLFSLLFYMNLSPLINLSSFWEMHVFAFLPRIR